MTVAEVIRALQALPSDARFLMPSRRSSNYVAPRAPILDTMSPSGEAAWQLCDYEDDGATTVVRLLGADEIDDRAERPRPSAN